MTQLSRLIPLAAIVLAVPSLASANTITVTSLTAADAVDATCTMREALDVATGGPAHPECAPAGGAGVLVISLPAGTLTITNEASANHAGWADFTGTLIIRGAGMGMTQIHNGSATPTRLLSVLTGADVTLEAMGIDGFDANPGEGSGGAIFVDRNGALTLRNVAFSDCHSNAAGAVVSAPFEGGASTRVTIEGCTFSGNDVTVAGAGALDLVDTTLSISGSTFTANEGAQANVLNLFASVAGYTATIRTSNFTDNVATRFGTAGGIRFFGPLTVLVEDCVFTGNVSSGIGAAIDSDSPITVTGSTFIDNRTTLGGAGAITTTAGIILRDSTFTNNVSEASGGAVQTGYQPCVIDGCRFEGNAAHLGGAIYHHSSVLTVTDSVFVDNVADIDTVTILATDDRATEGGDSGEITVSRTVLASAIRSHGSLTVHGSCFIGGVRPIVSSIGPTVDATGNYWTEADASVRGDIDSSSPTPTPPAGCDPAAVLTRGELTVTTTLSGTATPDVDYTSFAVPVVFGPSVSDVVIPVIALADAVADPEESVDLNVTFMGAGNTATVRITDAIAADLSIVKTADVTSAQVGDPIVFTLTVANAGPGDATDVVVTDALPAGLTLVAVTIDAPVGTTASCIPGPPASCTIASLPAGATATVTVRTLVSGSSNVTNRAEVSASADPDPTNDASEVVITVTPFDAGTIGDSGVRSDTGIARADAGPDGGGTPVTDGGCGCRVGAEPTPASDVAVLLTIGLALALRASRRAKRRAC